MSDEKVWRGWADWRKDRFYNFSSGKIYNFQIEAVALPAADYEALLADNTKLFQCAEDWRVQYEEAHERENDLQDKVPGLLARIAELERKDG